MKKTLVLLSFTLALMLFSCEKNNDCKCTTITAKKSTTTEVPVIDWGGSCSDITAGDIGKDSIISCTNM